MMPLQECKFQRALEPISVNGTAATCQEVDTIGWDHLTFIFMLGATTADMDELSLTESDTSGGTFTAITNGTFVDPTSTDDNKIWVASVPLRGTRKRYIKPVIDPGAAATLVAAVFILSNPVNAPTNNTENGTAEWLRLAG